MSDAFARMLETLTCPGRGLEYTDAAAAWCEGWFEGRADPMKEEGWQERGGPCKTRCELCGDRAWVDYFSRRVWIAKQ